MKKNDYNAIAGDLDHEGLELEERLLTWAVSRFVCDGNSHPVYPKGMAEWRKVDIFCRWHRLLPVLHYLLKNDPEFPDAPTAVVKMLQKEYSRSIAEHLFHRSHLVSILKRMNEEKVPTTVLKGIPLEEDLYPHIGLRTATDIDLMVPESDIPRTAATLNSLGFVQTEEREVRRRFQRYHHHLAPFVHSGTGVIVELHSRTISPSRPYQMDVESVWQRMRGTWVDEIPCYVLGREDLLHYLCLHFIGDRVSSRPGALLQICDIGLLLKRYGSSIAWDEFVEEAHRNHSHSAIHLALYAAQSIAGADVPADVFKRLQPPNFDFQKGNLFISRRVIGSNRDVPWGLAYALARPGAKGKLEGVYQSILSQEAWSPTGRDEPVTPSGRLPSLSLANVLRIGKGIKNAFIHPSSVRDQVKIDTWLADYLRSAASPHLERMM